MTARQEVEQRLRAKTPEAYAAFKRDFGGSSKPRDGQSWEEWKHADIAELVTFLPQNNAKAWSVLLHKLHVLSDTERAAQGTVTAADEARRANELAAQANRLSQKANEVSREANEIAKVARSKSKWAIILSCVAAAVSLAVAILGLVKFLVTAS